MCRDICVIPKCPFYKRFHHSRRCYQNTCCPIALLKAPSIPNCSPNNRNKNTYQWVFAMMMHAYGCSGECSSKRKKEKVENNALSSSPALNPFYQFSISTRLFQQRKTQEECLRKKGFMTKWRLIIIGRKDVVQPSDPLTCPSPVFGQCCQSRGTCRRAR